MPRFWKNAGAQIICLLLLGVSNSSAQHGPDRSSEAREDADAIRQERLKEIQYNEAKAMLSNSNLECSGVPDCRYVSGISTKPPKKKVALTFDDGPDEFGTPFVLDVLRKYKIKATFFMKGKHAIALPSLIQRVKDEGHLLIGNHTWNHKNFHQISFDQQTKEILSTHKLLSPYQEMKYFRYPFGNSTCASNELLHSMNYAIVGWHVDSCDWAYNETGSVSNTDAKICGVKSKNKANFVGHVVDQVKKHDGGIILMHDVQPNTIQKLDLIIEELIHEGFEFGSIDEPGFQSSMR